MQKWCMIVACLAVSLRTSPVWAEPQIVVHGLVKLIEAVDVPASRDGRLEKMLVKEGNEVAHGAALGQLNDTEAKLTVKRTELELQLASEKAQSEIAVTSARSVQEVARNEFQRAQQARQTAPGSISLTELDRLKLESEKAANELARTIEERRFALITSQAKAVEFELAKVALNEHRIVSPLDGIVIQLYHHGGEWVRTGEKVCRIVRVDRLRVEGFVDLKATALLTEGLSASFETDLPGQRSNSFQGEIVFVHPEADAVNGQLRVWAEFDNKERFLRPGQRGLLKIDPTKKKVVDARIEAPLNSNQEPQ